MIVLSWATLQQNIFLLKWLIKHKYNLHLLCWTKLTAIFLGTNSDGLSFFIKLSRSSFCLASSVASIFLILASKPRSTSGIPLNIFIKTKLCFCYKKNLMHTLKLRNWFLQNTTQICRYILLLTVIIFVNRQTSTFSFYWTT